MGKAKELAELGDKLTVSGSAVTVSGFNYDNIVDSAPGALDTLNELAAAIGDDANFSATVTNSIATKLPLAGGTLTGALTINTSGSGLPAINFNHTNANADNFQITAGTPGTANSGFTIRDIDASANRLVINTDGNVGIGTSSPTVPLHVDIGSDNNALYLQSSDQFCNIGLIDGSGSGKIIMDSGKLLFTTGGDSSTSFTGSSTRVTIDTSGNVGIGTTSPLSATNFTALTVQNNTYGGIVQVKDDTVDLRLQIQADTSGRVGTHSNHPLRFDVNSTERMRLDSSGNLLVGKTAINFATAGTEINPNGRTFMTFDGGGPLQLNRLTSHGDIIELHKDGTEVGSIGIESSGFYVDGEGSHAGLKFFLGSVAPRQNRVDIDSAIDLGWTGGKFKDIYASGTVYATPGGNDGSSANYAAKSANEILNNYGYKPSGLYWIREPNTGTPKQIYCDMETDGGGWMLWLEYNTGTNSMHNQATARANLGRSYNNNYSKYEVRVDASYVNQINRRSIRGVWELDANGGIRTNGFRNWGEVRLPETVGDQFQPDLDTYFNNSSNSEWIGRTEYYAIAGASGWTSIGSGSQYVYIREPNPAVKPGAIRSYGGITYEWAYDGTQYGWWVHESSYAEPMFNTLTRNAGFSVTYDNGRRDVFEPGKSNSDVNVNNGNNGPGVLGVGKGVLVGEFSIQFNLGYRWGWSEMYISDAVVAGNALATGGSPIMNKDQWSISNNNSNNQSYYNWKTSDGVSQATQSGLTPYSFGNYWTWNRQSNGSVYLRNPGGTVYTLGTFFGPMKFFSGAQSPHRAEILNVQSAGRNSALTASNEQAGTTLRH